MAGSWKSSSYQYPLLMKIPLDGSAAKSYQYNELIVPYSRGECSSVSFDEENNIILITPSSVDHTTMTEEDIVQLDLKGNIIGGKHKPSSEWQMHLRIITECKHATAVLHTHSPYATAYAVINEEIPYALAEMKYWTDGAIPVSPFGPIGSEKLGINAVETLKNRSTCLLQNHGTIAVGPTMQLAYMRAAYIEDAAQICIIAKGIGTIDNSFVTEG